MATGKSLELRKIQGGTAKVFRLPTHAPKPQRWRRKLKNHAGQGKFGQSHLQKALRSQPRPGGAR